MAAQRNNKEESFANTLSSKIANAQKRIRIDMNRQLFGIGDTMSSYGLSGNGINLERVNNGYIIRHEGNIFVYNSLKRALKHIESYINPPKVKK